jgi:hypothetical protein
MKTPSKILSELTGIPEYRILADDIGEYVTKRGALKAMEEYASQFKSEPDEKDKRIQELEKALAIADNALKNVPNS